MKYISKGHKKYNIEYHIEFCTKERRNWIQEFKVENELKKILQQIAEEQNVKIKTIAIQNDHVHLHISANPKFQIEKFMQYIKGKSSYLIKKNVVVLKDYPHSLWAKGYFISTVGTPNWKIQNYISKQDLAK